MDKLERKRKRIVSKGRFLFHFGQKMSLMSVGFGILLLGSLAAFATVLCIFATLFMAGGGLNVLGLTILVGCLAGVLFYLGANIDPGMPWTRASTTSLLPEESLVRASEEPNLQQATVLLRPAVHADQTPAEELVRSSVAPQGAADGNL